MRPPRFTYPGAYHHVINRGIQGETLFSGKERKTHFIRLLGEKAVAHRIRILAYCIMDTHYHLVLENTSGRLSSFLKQVNGQYATFYRKTYGGKGYLFQNRFQSTWIQDESYLLQAIAYVLLNPLRAKMVGHPHDYLWSSSRYPFGESDMDIPDWLDVAFVESLYQSRSEYDRILNDAIHIEPIIQSTRIGAIWGREDVSDANLAKFDRRFQPDPVKRKRIDDHYFEPLEKVLQEFSEKHALRLPDIPIDNHAGKRLRAELLVRLKDQAGLTYAKIAELDIFSDLQVSSLGRLYQNAKRRMR